MANAWPKYDSNDEQHRGLPPGLRKLYDACPWGHPSHEDDQEQPKGVAAVNPEELWSSMAKTLPALFECFPAPQSGIRVRTPFVYPDAGVVLHRCFNGRDLPARISRQSPGRGSPIRNVESPAQSTEWRCPR